MPRAKDGSFHLNTQRAMAHDKHSAGMPKPPAVSDGMESEHEGADEGGGHSQLHPHGDGSYHTVTSDGQQTDHPHLTHALAHLAGHHEPEHMHSAMQHHAEGGHVSSHHDGMEASGPHEHSNLEALKGHMDQFLNEEGQERY